MSRGKETEVEDKEVDDRFDQDATNGEHKRQGLSVYDGNTIKRGIRSAKIGKDPFLGSHNRALKKIRSSEIIQKSGYNSMATSTNPVGLKSLDEVETQDADYSLPVLSDELEIMILARFPILKYGKLCSLNKIFLELHRSGELFRLRKMLGIREFSIFMRAGEETDWWAFDRNFTSRKLLPKIPSDDCFQAADKETLCAGTHLIVSGMETFGAALWRYEFATNEWYKGPSMIDSRCLFASATSGDFAYVAGGIRMGSRQVLNSAEKYNPETKTWGPLPKMTEKRKGSSGIFMDNRFYVLGGQNESGDSLTCGEVFYEEKNMWVRILGMLSGLPVSTAGSPPLLAVVNNELYAIDTVANWLMVYSKRTNAWIRLGAVPVRTGERNGWGVAFKSLGSELLLIGGASDANTGAGMTIYTCRPDVGAGKVQWKQLDAGKSRKSNFIWNCCVMVA